MRSVSPGRIPPTVANQGSNGNNISRAPNAKHHCKQPPFPRTCHIPCTSTASSSSQEQTSPPTVRPLSANHPHPNRQPPSSQLSQSRWSQRNPTQAHLHGPAAMLTLAPAINPKILRGPRYRQPTRGGQPAQPLSQPATQAGAHSWSLEGHSR